MPAKGDYLQPAITCLMHEIDLQIERVAAFLEGDSGRLNYGQLVHFAHGQVMRCTWYTRKGATMPGGMSAEDLVGDTLRQVLVSDPNDENRRRIPPEVEVGKALRMIIRSKLSSLANSAENRSAMREVELESPEEPQAIWDRISPTGAPDEIVSNDDRAHAAARADAFIDFVASDNLVHSMLVLIRDEGLDKPAEAVARRLDVSVNDIYTAKRRMKTALHAFLAKESSK